MDMRAPTTETSHAAPADRLIVFYDGGCPLCRKEIGFYAKRPGAERIDWRDVSDPATPIPADLAGPDAGPSRCDLMARFHVREPDGVYRSGAAGFAALWRALPQFRWLGRIAAWPPVLWVLERGYRAFLHIRPKIQNAVAERERDKLLPGWLIGDLRSDHAGETGAVQIYKGILAVTRDQELRRFATEHLATEARHLELIEDVLAPHHRSKLLFLWRPAGWLTGALPALFGPRAVYRTIDAVETFVDHHYQEQIDKLAGLPAYEELRALLVACQEDEVEHRDQARDAGDGSAPGPVARAWSAAVGAGSAGAVHLARRF